jgi:hypothetical protein
MLDSLFYSYSQNAMRDYRTGQLLGTTIHEDQLQATEVIVNLFDGGPRSKVEYRVGAGPPVEMTRTRRPDPFVQELFVRFGETMKSWVKVEPSSHIWTARLPSDLGPGVHTLTVRAIDEYGREQVAHKLFEVVGQ